jgi:hypothetical protein
MTEYASLEPFDPATAWADPPGMGKALTIGVVIGTAASFLGVGAAFLIGGQGWGTAIGMGAFVAMWGGLGFGFMVSGVIWATRAEEAATRARLESRAAPARPVAVDAPIDSRPNAGRSPDIASAATDRTDAAPMKAAS